MRKRDDPKERENNGGKGWKEIEKDRQTDRLTNREIDRHPYG